MQRLADSNLWLALTLSKHSFHAVSREWLENLPAGEKLVFCRATQQSFLRLLTTKEVLAPYGNPPLSNAAAWAKYQEWLATALIGFAHEPAGIEMHWRRLAAANSASPKLWMDAYLGAFAIAGGMQLVTIDRAFQQFKDLDSLVLAREE
jgi:toxin-antitoxin system PIN domain toxin